MRISHHREAHKDDHRRSRSARTASGGDSAILVRGMLARRARSSSGVSCDAEWLQLPPQVVRERHPGGGRARAQAPVQRIGNMAAPDQLRHVHNVFCM